MAHYDAETAHALIQQIYLAAADTTRWSGFLELLRRTIDAANTTFVFVDRQHGGGRVHVAAGLGEDVLQLYHARYSRIDPFANGAAALGPLTPGFIGLAQDLVSEEELERCQYYKEFGKPSGCIGGLVCVIYAEGPLTAMIGANRQPGRYFGEAEVSLFRQLFPHLRTGLQIHRELLRDVHIGRAALATLNLVPSPTYVCDEHGTVLHHNDAANRLHSGAVLRGRITLPSHIDSQRLHGAIATAARAVGRGATTDLCVPLQNSFSDPTVAVVSPVHQHDAVSLVPPLIAVIIGAMHEHHGPVWNALAKAYRLTPTEARLAIQLAQGYSLRDAAKAANISYETGRTYLKQIFDKTNTRRQTELVRKILTTPSALAD